MVELVSGFARTPRECIESLGLQYHPSLTEYLKEDGHLSTEMPHHEAVDVVYRTDLKSQYMELEPFPPVPPYAPLG